MPSFEQRCGDAILPRQAVSSSSSHANIAFIVHSSNSLTNNLPPDVDNKPLARQKRRRTSPEDQVILENEYLRNPKPDKAARMAIVQRVALGEKEVQIWFQNRRQASRRKSRPLEPHEYAQYQSLRLSQGGDPLSSEQSRTLLEGPDGNLEPRTTYDKSPSTSSFASTPVHGQSSQLKVDGSGSSLGSSLTRYQSFEQASQKAPSSQEKDQFVEKKGDEVRSRRGSNVGAAASQASPTESKSRQRELHRISSNVRLSLTADGAAKIITKDDSSPSPPRKRPSDPLPTGNAVAGTDETDAGTDMDRKQTPKGSRPALTRKASGRSRDSRAWEFWADKDARSELAEMAHEETSGSAADAIGRLRSTSGRHILGALTGKRGPSQGDARAQKRTKRAPLLQRSQSLVNKSSPDWTGKSKSATSPKKLKKAQSGLGIQIVATDSDKENWSPDRPFGGYDRTLSPTDSEATDAGPRRETVTPGKTLRVLDGIDEHAADSSEADGDDEVARFMGERNRKSNSASEEEELDCVQGLLSLSQGNWK